jgi:hypothetical protein
MLPNWLPINVIAEEWSKETRQSSGFIERSLVVWFGQCAHEIEAPKETDDWTDPELENWSSAEGVTRETFMSREYFKIFCKSEDSPLPSFWFPEVNPPKLPSAKRGRLGRPSPKPDFIKKFHELVEAGEIDFTMPKKQAARQLQDALPNVQHVRLTTIGRYIKDDFDREKRNKV